MLAVRGNPKIALVAHTDVCRNHAKEDIVVKPTIKLAEIEGEARYIIQDENCEIQVGGDDRLGVAINSWLALTTGWDLGLLFTTDEEVGVVSAEYCRFPQLKDFDLLVQVDRGNRSHQIVSNIGGWDLCEKSTVRRLIQISEEIGLPRYEVQGMLTDVLAIKSNHMCKEAINLTCGYHNSYGAAKNEYIDIQEAKDTMKFVNSIISDYELEDLNDPRDLSVSKNEDEEEETQFTNYEEVFKALSYEDHIARKGRTYTDDEEEDETDLFSEERYNAEKMNEVDESWFNISKDLDRDV